METPTTRTPAEAKLHFLDYWRIIRIRKTVILAVFMLVLLTTVMVTYILPKSYMSMVRIAVEKDTTDVPGLFDRQTATPYDPYFIQNQFEIIQSKSVLHPVIDQLKLNEEFATRYNADGPLKTADSFEILKKLIDVRQTRNTSLIEIRVYYEDPKWAADIANKIAEVYKDNRKAKRVEMSDLGIGVLTNELSMQETKVSAAETRLSELRTTLHISDAMADADAPAQTLEPETVRRLESERIGAQANLAKYETLVTNLTNMPRELLRKALATAYPGEAELMELLTKRDTAEQELARILKDGTKENPDVQRIATVLDKINLQIENKIDGVLAGLKAVVESSRAQVQTLVDKVQEAKENDSKMAATYRPYFEAKRRLSYEQKMKDVFALKITQEKVEKALPRSSIVEITDRAEAGPKPVRPNIPLNIALGIIVGLVVGVGLAFFIEYLDTSVKTIDDVERALQAPVLGVIPQNVGHLLDEGPDSPHAEAYRVLRTNLLFSRKDDTLNSITVVSGGAGEGKSTTVFNLATVFAQSGQRVLIVDSDLRRPSIHKFLKVSNSIGLTNYLLRQKSLEEVVQTTALPTLDFLPSGKLPSSSMGILNSVQMKEFIREAKQRYDFVFFDSPPIMGVSDASVLASEVDMSLLVVQYRKYPQQMTVRAKQMVEKVGGTLLGVVLNNINISQDSYYYYYSGYYYDYYSKHEDEETPAKTPTADSKKAGGDSAKLEIKRKY
ncbi:MAG: GumC family protein [Limisphaerales bacterium]